MLWKRHKTNENSFDTSSYINECWKGIFEAETDQVSTEVNDEASKAWKYYSILISVEDDLLEELDSENLVQAFVDSAPRKLDLV